LGERRVEELKRSLDSVTSRFTHHFSAAISGEMDRDDFLRRYGHLRPGTYDILSLRYDQRPDLMAVVAAPAESGRLPVFGLTSKERDDLTRLFREAGLESVGADEFVAYARLAMAQREEAKFVFTRHLSEILEAVAEWGSGLGLDREQLSYLTLSELLDPLDNPLLEGSRAHFEELVAQRREGGDAWKGIRLGYLIRDVRDLYVVPQHRSAPNFVSTRRVEADTVVLDHRTADDVDMAGRVVCIENADPGFDWIFTRGIAGLISEFGGANSHMTIRCAELGLPAAIGVGQQTFERLRAASRVELDCGARVIRAIGGA